MLEENKINENKSQLIGAEDDIYFYIIGINKIHLLIFLKCL